MLQETVNLFSHHIKNISAASSDLSLLSQEGLSQFTAIKIALTVWSDIPCDLDRRTV